MLYGMNGAVVQAWLLVGYFHANVEGGDDFSAHLVLAAYVDAAE